MKIKDLIIQLEKHYEADDEVALLFWDTKNIKRSAESIGINLTDQEATDTVQQLDIDLDYSDGMPLKSVIEAINVTRKERYRDRK